MSVIHLDVIQSLSGQDSSNEGDSKDTEKVKTALSDTDVNLQLQCNILIQMLCDYKPALRQELGLSSEIKLDDTTASIEVLWRGSLNRRFFTIPDICGDLAKSSKDELVSNIDRKNVEVKLIDFVARAHDLYLQVKHQERLNALHLNLVFSRKNLDYASWAIFGLAAAINALLIAFYQNYSFQDGPIISNEKAKFAVDILNYIQIATAFYCLLSCIVVRSYVVYESFQAKKLSPFWSVVYTAADPITIYYAWYLSFSILGVTSSDFFTPFLLLDIIMKNSTTRDVLMAIVVPAGFLMWALLFMIFIIYIFAFFIFLYYSHEGYNSVPITDDEAAEKMCDTLWHCFLSSFGYGLRSGGGMSDFFNWDASSNRLFLCLLYFAVCLVILFNVVFGIIIDTFSSLRADKLAKLSDTINKCFICGIDKKVFDRASDVPDGFGRHIREDHKMWNYLYFIFYLWEQDKDDDDGMEYYVRHCIDDGDITWFPINHAMCLDLAMSDEQLAAVEMEKSLQNFQGNVITKIENFQFDVAVVLDKLTSTLMANADDGMSVFGLNSSIVTDFNESITEYTVEESEVAAMKLHIFLLLQKIVISGTIVSSLLS